MVSPLGRWKKVQRQRRKQREKGSGQVAQDGDGQIQGKEAVSRGSWGSGRCGDVCLVFVAAPAKGSTGQGTASSSQWLTRAACRLT